MRIPIKFLGPMALALATFGASAPCRAGIVLELPNVTAAPSSTGSFDVLIFNTLGSTTSNVSGDSIEVRLTGIAGVTFSAVSIATVTTYVYVTSGTTQGGGPFSFNTFPNTDFTASDAEFASPFFRAIAAGQTFGLAHVSYTVAAGAVLGSSGTLAFNTSNGATSLSDVNGNAIGFTTSGGTFTVMTTAVPEPSTWLLTAFGALGSMALGSARRRRAVA